MNSREKTPVLIPIGDVELRLDMIARALGIPAATLEKLASGEWVAVPMEPTEAITDAFVYARAKEPSFGEHFDSIREFNRRISRDIWRSMLDAAAPEPTP